MVAAEIATTAETEPANRDGLRRDALTERLKLLGLCSPALLLVLVVMVLPVAWLFWLSFLGNDGAFTLEHYQRMIEKKSYGRIFWTTFKVSILTTALGSMP